MSSDLNGLKRHEFDHLYHGKRYRVFWEASHMHGCVTALEKIPDNVCMSIYLHPFIYQGEQR